MKVFCLKASPFFLNIQSSTREDNKRSPRHEFAGQNVLRNKPSMIKSSLLKGQEQNQKLGGFKFFSVHFLKCMYQSNKRVLLRFLIVFTRPIGSMYLIISHLIISWIIIITTREQNDHLVNSIVVFIIL